MLESIDSSRNINIAIVGRANTGKSSLMNALLKLSRKEALQITQVGTESPLTKDFIIQKFFYDDVYLIDTPPIDDKYFEHHKIVNIIEHIDLVILIIEGYPVYKYKSIFEKLSIYKAKIFIVLNNVDKWDDCFPDWVSYTVSQWANYLNVDKIYQTCTRGYNPREDSSRMEIRGVDLLRQDINNFINEQNNKKQQVILNQLNTETITNKLKKENVNLDFKDVLKSCQQTAYKSYEINLTYSDKVSKILRNLISDLDKNNYVLNQYKNKELHKLFKEIISAIKQILNKDIDDLKSSLAQKKRHLEDYTIVLFGRTRAGKSTIREVLTKGDGSTIGKGGQRTTRDVHEYRWNNLRLIDTPGIEAYGGEEDTCKATKKIDEADMVLFLTSDDSVQPGEFEEMAKLSQINKPFIVLLNVKTKLETEAQLKRFLTKPKKTFDEERLSGHHHHIQEYVNQHLNISQVPIIDIQARAGFLSNLPEYDNFKTKLWELSRLDQVYEVITEDIYKNGNKRRASTFFDGTKNSIDNIREQLLSIKIEINSQITFLKKENKKIKTVFKDFIKDTDKKLESEIKVIFSQFKQKIPRFVDLTVGTKNAEHEWKIKQKKFTEKLERSMVIIFEQVIQELKEKLSEIQAEYSYDAENINFHISFDNFDKGMFGNILKGLSLLLGVVGAGVIILNPAAWVIGAGLTIGNMIFGWVSSKVKDNEKRKINEQKQNIKNDLLNKLSKEEEKLITKLKKEVKLKLEEVESDIISTPLLIIEELHFINEKISISEKEINKILHN